MSEPANLAVVTGKVVIDKERLVERQQVTDMVRKERVEVEEATKRAPLPRLASAR